MRGKNDGIGTKKRTSARNRTLMDRHSDIDRDNDEVEKKQNRGRMRKETVTDCKEKKSKKG